MTQVFYLSKRFRCSRVADLTFMASLVAVAGTALAASLSTAQSPPQLPAQSSPAAADALTRQDQPTPQLGQAVPQAAEVATSGDKSSFHLLHPVPRHQLRDLSTDRPDTTESPYTVDAGHLQIELSFIDYTRDRSDSTDPSISNGQTSQTRRVFAVAPMLIKVGLLHNMDFQLGIDPYTHERTSDGDSSTSVDGFGDTVARLKINLWGNDTEGTAFAIMPFVKFPTARNGLGNGVVEGGIIAVLSMPLPNGFSLGLMAELDFNQDTSEPSALPTAGDDQDTRYSVDFVHTVTISRDLLGDLAGYIEYAGFLNLNDDEDYRGYFNGGFTYGLTNDVQLDCGVRVGLTEAADDLGLFTGISVRY